MTQITFRSERLAAAHIDYQVKVEPIGYFPSELSSILLTGAFPLSPSPISSQVEGLKVFTYQERYLCFCWFFEGGREDERGRKTNSSRVLLFPVENAPSHIPVLADVREWLKTHDVETMTDAQFYQEITSLENSSLSSVLVKKAQTSPWFPHLLAKLLQQKQVIIQAPTEDEAFSWLEILWFYTPDFLRFKIDWCTYAWSLRTDHEAVIMALGKVEPPPSPSLLQRLFKRSPATETEFRFDVAQGVSSHPPEASQLKPKPLEWLCQQWLEQKPWPGWQGKKQRQFILDALETLSNHPQVKINRLISGYPKTPKLQEFIDLFKQWS